MNRSKRSIVVGLICLFSMMAVFAVDTPFVDGAEKKKKSKKTEFTLPENVRSIQKENTFPNVTEEIELLEPSEETKQLLKESDVKIANSEVIKMLNESVINPSPLAIGYRATIYLGRWPLRYESESTSTIWDYQLINDNDLDNQDGNDVQELRYIQQEEKEVKGALTNKISHASTIKQMMLETSQRKTKLPLAFKTVFGANTKLKDFYHVPANKRGKLAAYAPAINEKGQVTFGEVYIQLKGSDKELVVKNITQQGIGAWIPIQDHVSMSFQLK